MGRSKVTTALTASARLFEDDHAEAMGAFAAMADLPRSNVIRLRG
ncbi:hypothetical protein [Mycolicibacterium sp.]